MNYGPYIICEGADGTGKTFLARELERYGFRYVHAGPPEKDALAYYVRGLRRLPGLAVADRLHVGSWVYGRAFRNGPDLTDQEEWLFEGYLMARGAVLVYCSVDPEVIGRNLERGPDSEDAKIYEAPEKRAVLRELYEEFVARRTALLVVRYDFTASEDARTRTASGLVTQVRNMETLLPRFEVAALGNTQHPRFIFVGDRPNRHDAVEKRDRSGEWNGALVRKFAAIFDNGICWGDSPSGRYLFQCLRAAGLSLADYCTFNSVQWDGRTVVDLAAEDPKWWHRQTSGADIVALGQLASEQLTAAGIPHRRVPHPQYSRRFFYKRVLDYGKLLTGEKEYRDDEWKH